MKDGIGALIGSKRHSMTLIGVLLLAATTYWEPLSAFAETRRRSSAAYP